MPETLPLGFAHMSTYGQRILTCSHTDDRCSDDIDRWVRFHDGCERQGDDHL